MSVYGELDTMVEYRTQFAVKSKRKHIAKVNMPNIAFPNRHIDIEIPHGSRYHLIVPDALKITFNLDNESKDKARSIVKNVGKALEIKMMPMVGLKDINTINNSDVYDTYRNLYLREKKT